MALKMNEKETKQSLADYHAVLIESLKDQREAEAYWQVALEEYDEDGDSRAFMLALKHLTEAKGEIARITPALV